MVKLGIGLPRVVFYVYVALTLVEVALQRDDFPISRFPMFSRTREARPMTFKYLTAVSDAGERRLEEGDVQRLFGGDLSARVIYQRASRNRELRKRMLANLAARVDSLPSRGPRPFALRYYAQHFLDGVESNKLLDAVYVPPPALLERLASEARATAAPLPLEKASHGDRLVELDDSHCRESCSMVVDALASQGSAIRLESSEKRPGSATFTLPAGSWFVLLRLRTKAAPPNDVVTLEVKGRGKALEREEIGNHKRVLPSEGWVWSSSQPGWPALELTGTRKREVTILGGREPVDIDQIWLREKGSELPTWNAPVVAPEGGSE